MSTLAKILVVVNLLLSVGFLASASSYLGNQDTWAHKLKVAEQRHQDQHNQDRARIDDLAQQVGVSDANVRAANAAKAKAETENARLLSENANLTASFNSLSENHSVLARTVDRMTNTLNANRDLISTQQDTMATQREQIAALQESRNQGTQILNAKELALDRAQQLVTQLEAQLGSANEKIRTQEFSLATFRERFPGVEVASQPPHSGKVLSVNGTSAVVVSLGAEDGVRPGFLYMVSRGGTYIGDLQIDDVQSKKSAGFVVGSAKSPIQAGDDIHNAR
jgi:hypothetical protein